MNPTTKRIHIHDVTEPDGLSETTARLLREHRARQAAARDADDPATSNQLTAAEYEASARALEEAGQPTEAIQSWHRAAIAHAKAGNTAEVIASIVHCEHLAGNLQFAPELARKGTAADAAIGAVETLDGIPDDRKAAAQTTANQDPRALASEQLHGNQPLGEAVEQVSGTAERE